MKNISILVDVLGPVMRGPSSSHTAGSYHIAALARSLLGDNPAEAEFTFDPRGSYAPCYRVQGSDLAFAAGLLGWRMTDERFERSLELAGGLGLDVRFGVADLEEAQHPNTVQIRLRARGGRTLRLVARSIGGGAVEITRLEDWPVLVTGSCHAVFVEAEPKVEGTIRRQLEEDGRNLGETRSATRLGLVLLSVERAEELPAAVVAALRTAPGVRAVWSARPLSFVKRRPALLGSAEAMVAAAERDGLTLGQVAARYEAHLLGLSEEDVIAEMTGRFEIMVAAARRGLGTDPGRMQLLRPTAGRIFAAESEGRLAVGGLHARAAARAMAAMHVNCGMGVVCAAPTAGSAGVLPGVLSTLAEERGLSARTAAMCLLAAGAVGVVVAERSTFAAEVAGCQVEIGAAGAMAAAAVVEYAGGTARQAADAAAISFQNTMGMVCDLVQGIVEIPCHTRNAVAASSAFVCADLVLGGYENPIPLDETVDAVHAVGQAMPRELRVTSLGGLAVAPSALAMERLR